MIAVSEKVGAWLAVPEKVGKGKPAEKVGAWLAVPEKVGKGKPAEKVGAWLAVPEKAGEGKPAEKAARKEAGEDNAIPVQIKLWKSGMTITHNCIHTSRCERQWAG